MNATNRPVDLLLNSDSLKMTQPQRRENDVSALNKRENSFDDVYRQQRREDTEVDKNSRHESRNKPADRAEERPQQARQVTANQPQTEQKKVADGKALPPEKPVASNVAADGKDRISSGLEGVDESSENSEQMGPGFIEEDVDKAVQTQSLNLQATSSVADVQNGLKQTRSGDAVEGALKTDVNGSQQAKGLTGSALEQTGQVQLQDRFAQLAQGQEFKLLREQANLGNLNVGQEKALAAEAVNAAANVTESGAERLPRLNSLTPGVQSLSQTRPGTVTASVQTPVSSADWSQAVSQRIAWLVNRGISAAELQLNPRELGPVDVRINVNGEQANIQFTSQHAAVREALESSVGRLREMLESSGLNLVDVGVSDQSHSEQAQADAREASGAGQGSDVEEQDNAAEAQTVQRIESDSLVDFYA